VSDVADVVRVLLNATLDFLGEVWHVFGSAFPKAERSM
jgi:hypothetical protein